jgi:ATP-dependent protease ClpP protease subunit
MHPTVGIHFNSCGGNMRAMLSMATCMMALRDSGVTISTHCDAEASSGAALLFLMGDKDKRYMSSYASIMLHSVSSELSGTVKDSIEYLKNSEHCYTELLRDDITGLYSTLADVFENPFDLLTSGKDYYFTYQDCVDNQWVKNAVTGETDVFI